MPYIVTKHRKHSFPFAFSSSIPDLVPFCSENDSTEKDSVPFYFQHAVGLERITS